MKESKCWIDEATGKIIFEDVNMAIAFNLEKQEEIRDYIENKKKLSDSLTIGIRKMIPTPLRYDIETWEIVKNIAESEMKNLK